MLPRRGNQCCKAHCRSERLRREVGSTQLWGSALSLVKCMQRINTGQMVTMAVTSGSGGSSRRGLLYIHEHLEVQCCKVSHEEHPHERTSTPLQLSMTSMLMSTGNSQIAKYLSRVDLRPTWLEIGVGSKRLIS